MPMPRTSTLLAIAIGLLALGSQSQAQEAPSTLNPAAITANIVVCPEGAIAPHEAEDEQLLLAVSNAFSAAGFGGIRVYLPRLREAMERAPACYPEIERRGQAILIRTDDFQQYLAQSLVVAGVVASSGQPVSVAQGPNVYMNVSLVLGSYANELRQHEEALSWLNRGLALQPHAQLLIAEKATAMAHLGQRAEAYDLLRAEIDSPDAASDIDRSRFLRMSGVFLIDLNRLDEAETALNESIRLNPNNPGARNELLYIAHLRGGQARTDAQMVAPNAPRPPTQ
ncbi:MAG: hypothetical protein ABL864_12490 [Terricaulis sp.]